MINSKNSPQSVKIFKRAANNVIDNLRKAPQKQEKAPILMSYHHEGHGLWCHPTDKVHIDKAEVTEMKKSLDFDLMKSGINADFQNDVDKKLNSQLKEQVQDLLGKLENVYTNNQILQYKASRAENNVKGLQDIITKQNNEMHQFEDLRRVMEQDIANLNEALSNAKAEISRLRGELSNESERSGNYYKLYSELLQEKEQIQQGHLGHNLELGMSNPYQYYMNQNINNNHQDIVEHPLVVKIKEEFEEKAKIYESEKGKLVLEITDLKKKLSSEEGNRSKLNEIIKTKNEKIELLNYELKKYKEIFVDCGNEVKWNQDLVKQKDSMITVLKENLKKKEIEIENLNKQLEKEKLKVMGKYVEEVKEEKRKPVLFGPENDNLDY